MAGGSRHPLIPILLFSLACGVVGFFVLKIAGVVPRLIHVFPLAYFLVLTLALHHWQERALVADPKGFVNRFMLGLMIKLFCSLIIVVALLLLLPRPTALPLVLLLLFLYMAFLAFSTVRMAGLSRKPSAPRK